MVDVLLLAVQLTPALTDLKDPIIYICYRRIFVIANIGIKEKPLKGLGNSFCYRRISITGGSVRAGFNCSWSIIKKYILYTLLIVYRLVSRLVGRLVGWPVGHTFR